MFFMFSIHKKKKIFAFNDIKDRATIIGVNASDIHVVDTKDLTWSREEWNSSSAESHVEVAGGNNLLLGEDGAIKLKVLHICLFTPTKMI